MVSSSPSKRDVGANSLSKSSVTLVSGPKPLVKHKFYLDVKNHITSSKLEAKIRELGGFLELFLVKEVTHLVTDKEGWASASKGGGNCPKTPQTPSNTSSIYNDHGTPERTPNRGRPKTRADAMLERARKTPVVIAKDPLEQAKNWGITVWSIEKTLNWLEKVVASIQAKKRKVKELKVPFVKYESFDRRHRPVFLEIRNWPSFNLWASAGSSGLVHKAASEQQNMTRKSRTAPHPPAPAKAAAVQSGYCEVCRADYALLEEHLESEKHLAFVGDNANFLDLDNLISDGTDIGSFLKINGAKDDKCNGLNGRNHSPVIQHKMPRTRTSSICDKIKNSQMSPIGSDSGHRLRSRRANTVTNNYIGFTADDDTPIKPEGAREARELRSSHRTAMMKIAEQESDMWSSGRPKRSCIRQKVISIDDNVISEHRGYYRVEVPAKLKPGKESDVEKEKEKKRAKSPVVIPPDDKSLIVKFRRMRTSELMQLNSEAENFLFPKNDNASTTSEEEIDGDCPNTTVSTGKGDSTILLSSEDDQKDDEHSMDSIASSDCSGVKKKKRMTHAEAFIMDNKKYYKFEMPGSRLRYHGSLMSDLQVHKMARSNGDISPETKRVIKDERVINDEAGNDEETNKLDLNSITFSFERIPKSETWYETFSRQDQGEQYYTCFSDSGYWKPFLLPYEIGPIPPLDPKLCIQSYSQVKKQIAEGLISGSNSAGCSTSEGCLLEDDSKSSDDDSESVDNSDKDEDYYCPDQARLRPSTTGRNPRKSPRQHASTLAILSSLVQQRKKRALNRSAKAAARSSSAQSLEVIPEDVVPEDKIESEDFESMARSIDDLLSNAYADFSNSEHVEICDQDNLFSMDCKIDAIKIVEDYEDSKQGINKTPVRKKPGRKPGRKKANRTGWPKTCRRRREVIHEEVDGSTVDSLSVNVDSEDADADDSILPARNNLKSGKNSFGEQIVKFVNKTDQSQNASVNKNKTSEINVQSVDRVKPSKEIIKSDRVVDLEKWENAEKVLAAKISNDVNKDLQFQPFVRVKKLDGDSLKVASRRLRSSSSPQRTLKRARRMPASPKSPRVLRKPRGRWYRER